MQDCMSLMEHANDQRVMQSPLHICGLPHPHVLRSPRALFPTTVFSHHRLFDGSPELSLLY